MSGFSRRYSSMPGVDVLTQIEGVVTVDNPAPGAIAGVSAGVACCVGEFADVTSAVAVDANGVVSTAPNPIEVFSGQDVASQFGGWDETIGEFGISGGNGWLEIKNKAFSRLVLVAINNASSQGARVIRKLPTCTSASDPTPVVPVVGASVLAGREFKTSSNRVRTAKLVQFGEAPAYLQGIDGTVTHAGSTAATQPFSTAGGKLTTVVRSDGSVGVEVGDIVVMGVIGGAGALGADADTYRVYSIESDTACHLEKMDGSAFDFTASSSLPWRVHVASVADSAAASVATAGQTFVAQGGYLIPCRPLDATIAAAAALTPTVAPAALTAISADPLSGLMLYTDQTTGLVYTAAVQAPNVAASSTLDALYETAIDSLLADDLPEREVNIVWSARSSSNIDTKLFSHTQVQKASGVGRISTFSPPLTTVSVATACGDASPGVGNARYREGIYNWPGLATFVPEAVGFNIKGADGLLHNDGNLDVPSQSWAAAIMSQLAAERNPAQYSDPVPTVMALATGIQRAVSGLGINQYTLMKSKGVMGPRNDRDVGRVFQSGVTRSLIAGEQDINTRRFSFFVEDSVAAFLVNFSKEPMSESLQDKIVGAFHDFFDQMLSTQNPSAARIRAYTVDDKSGNTQVLEDQGIFVVQYAVEMIPIANTIVQQASIGYGVINVQTLAA